MASPLLAVVERAVLARSPLAGATIAEVSIGDRLLLVEVEDRQGGRSVGVAHRPPGRPPSTPTGQPVPAVTRWATAPTATTRHRAIGLAVLNALSAPLIDWRVGDPFEGLGEAIETIATVGLFAPVFRKFGEVDVRVVERRAVTLPASPAAVTVSIYDPAEVVSAFAGADAVFVTGSSLVYGGTERYLEAASAVPVVILVGATASFVPAPAFEAGATALAGVRVDDVDSVRAGIRTGACATDLHGDGLTKVIVTATDA